MLKQMKETINSRLLKSFEQVLFSSFEDYCHKHQIEKNYQNFSTYLIDKQLLNSATIKRYTITHEFTARYPLNGFNKTKTIDLLADLFDLSSRHIWSLVKYGDQLNSKNSK